MFNIVIKRHLRVAFLCVILIAGLLLATVMVGGSAGFYQTNVWSNARAVSACAHGMRQILGAASKRPYITGCFRL